VREHIANHLQRHRLSQQSGRFRVAPGLIGWWVLQGSNLRHSLWKSGDGLPRDGAEIVIEHRTQLSHWGRATGTQNPPRDFCVSLPCSFVLTWD
jgi:hypothetical protein